MRTLTTGAIARRSRRLAWHHPEWWALGLALAAWAALVGLNLAGAGVPAPATHQHHSASALSVVLAEMGHWQLMVLAMMLPVVVPPLRVVAFRSLWNRRHRAIAAFLLGYLAVWALVGLAVSTLVGWVGAWPREAVATSFLLAAGWQWSPIKQRALIACHRTMPLAARGTKADRDCIRFGGQIGRSCCANCWALMLACTLTGHSLIALVACGWISLAERAAWRPNTRLISLSLAGLAGVFWLMQGR